MRHKSLLDTMVQSVKTACPQLGRSQLSYFSLLLLMAFLTGCFENDSLSASQVVVDGDDLELSLIEYTDLQLSTYFDDSLATNSQETFMLGHHQDNFRGKIHAEPFLHFGTSTTTAIHADAKLDSTVLVLFYEAFHYDTLPGFDIEVFELTEEMEEDDDGNIYSFQQFDHAESPLISAASRAIPHKDSLTITLPAEFGQRLFDLGKENDGIFASNENLMEVFKGLVLSTADESPLLTFQNSSYIGFFYRIPSDLDEGSGTIKISVENGEGYFTHLDIDRNSTFFSAPLAYENIPSADAGGVAMTDQLLGASIRIEVPNIHELLELAENYYITSASLRLPLTPNTYDRYFNLPLTSLSTFIVDKKNRPLYSLGTTSLTSWDEQFQEKTYYEIPIKDFIDYKLSKGINNEDALWITVPSSAGFQTSGLTVSTISPEQKIKIDITYLPLN